MLDFNQKKMKRKIYITLLLGTIVLSSCKKLIEVDPVNSQPGTETLKLGKNVQGVLTSAYERLTSNQFLAGEVIRTNEIYGDDVDFANATGGAPAQFVSRDFSLFNQQGRDLWAAGYTAIGYSNVVIDAVDNNLFTDYSDAQKAQMKAQALFIRGVAHFELVRLFAKPYSNAPTTDPGIPVRIIAATSDQAKKPVPRNTVDEVYKQVILDLKAAEGNLVSANSVFATKWAAKAYLARVYFNMGDYANAFTYSNDVITNGGFSLGTSVIAPFNTTGGTVPSPLPTGVLFLAVSDGSLLRGNFWNTDLNATFLPLSTQLYADINSKGGNRKTQLTTVANKPVDLKWSGGAGINVPTIRLAEMYLTRAESRVQKGGFVDSDVRADYNAVRAVANVSPDNTTTGAAALLAAIRTERHVELALEGDRFHELRRLKSNIRGIAYNDSKQLLKIPDSETTANPNIVQN